MAASRAGAGTRKASAATRGGGHTDDSVVIELTHARWRHFAWALVGLGLGVLLALRLQGWIKVFSLLALLPGLSAGMAFARTLLHPPGTIRLQGDQLELTPRLCSGATVAMPIAEVRSAYLLRRALPWTTAAPVLVVETGRGVFEYPRDWFVSESDQRKIATALNRGLGRT